MGSCFHWSRRQACKGITRNRSYRVVQLCMSMTHLPVQNKRIVKAAWGFGVGLSFVWNFRSTFCRHHAFVHRKLCTIITLTRYFQRPIILCSPNFLCMCFKVTSQPEGGTPIRIMYADRPNIRTNGKFKRRQAAENTQHEILYCLYFCLCRHVRSEKHVNEIAGTTSVCKIVCVLCRSFYFGQPADWSV